MGKIWSLVTPIMNLCMLLQRKKGILIYSTGRVRDLCTACQMENIFCSPGTIAGCFAVVDSTIVTATQCDVFNTV